MSCDVEILHFGSERNVDAWAKIVSERMELTVKATKIELPLLDHWNAERKQLDGNTLLTWLAKKLEAFEKHPVFPLLEECERKLGEPAGNRRWLLFTLVDMFCLDLDLKPFAYAHGVALLDGRVGVLSLARLKTNEEVIEVAVHEIGHMYGLEHCSNECAMRARFPVPSTPSDFCGWCQRLFEAHKRRHAGLPQPVKTC